MKVQRIDRGNPRPQPALWDKGFGFWDGPGFLRGRTAHSPRSARRLRGSALASSCASGENAAPKRGPRIGEERCSERPVEIFGLPPACPFGGGELKRRELASTFALNGSRLCFAVNFGALEHLRRNHVGRIQLPRAPQRADRLEHVMHFAHTGSGKPKRPASAARFWSAPVLWRFVEAAEPGWDPCATAGWRSPRRVAPLLPKRQEDWRTPKAAASCQRSL